MTLHTSTVEIQTRDGAVDGFVAAPDDGAEHAGVLFYMDAFGVRPRLEEMAGRIAEQGYVVLVPNVFYRSRPAPVVDTSDLMDPQARAGKFGVLRPMMAELTPERAMSDADAYLEFLAAHPGAAQRPIGVTGYCMGGALALRTAAHRPEDVAAAAAFHPARLATDAEDSPHLLARRIKAEVYVGSADRDQGMPPEQQQRLDEALTAAGVRHTCEQYDGATHGFTMSDTAVYDEAATERHWDALLGLFARNLG
ncbi:MAG: dienelactone hydrolase family protein [Nocardioidaceae bacterium]|nr:dienelactone hydrolase family protein [Nocardioidaceae bacterium]